jgi:hypothetical protein
MSEARINLTPKDELTPGAVGAIRNSVIESVVALAAKELNISADKLVVRDVRPFSDLQMSEAGTTIKTADDWYYDATTTTAASFTSVTGARTMGDQRYVAIYGVRDLRKGFGIHATTLGTSATTLLGAFAGNLGGVLPQLVSMIKVNVGGSDKVIWDINGIYAYDDCVGFTSAAVIIPQNASFNISYYLKSCAVPGTRIKLQLIGVAVEPRGKVVSP